MTHQSTASRDHKGPTSNPFRPHGRVVRALLSDQRVLDAVGVEGLDSLADRIIRSLGVRQVAAQSLIEDEKCFASAEAAGTVRRSCDRNNARLIGDYCYQHGAVDLEVSHRPDGTENRRMSLWVIAPEAGWSDG